MLADPQMSTPTEPVPVLHVVVHDERHPRVDPEVAELDRVLRRDDDGVAIEGGTHRDHVRQAVRSVRGEASHASEPDHGRLRLGELRAAHSSVPAPASTMVWICSTISAFASVVTSPSGRPRATSRSSRRMILPERVFGRSAVKMIPCGRAILPILSATCSRSSAATSSPLEPRLQRHERDDRLSDDVVRTRHDGRLGHLLVVDQGALDLVRGQAVTRHIHHVVDPSRGARSSPPRRAWRRRRRRRPRAPYLEK